MGRQPVELARRAVGVNPNLSSWVQVSATGADATSRFDVNRVRGEADNELLAMKDLRTLCLGVGVIKTDLPLPLTGKNALVYKVPGIRHFIGLFPMTHAWSGLGNATVHHIANASSGSRYMTASDIHKFDD